MRSAFSSCSELCGSETRPPAKLTARFDPLGILRALNLHGVRSAVVGGFAVAAHGVIRATEDLDIVTDRGLENATCLSAALASLNATASQPLEPEVLVRRLDLKVATDLGSVHLLREVPGVPAYRNLARASVEVAGVVFEIPTLSALRQMKTVAGRPKDAIDLAELDELHGPATD